MNLKAHHHKHDVFPLIKGILLMLPLLFVLFTSLYVIFNQNARDSFSAYRDAKSVVLENGDSTIDGVTYNLVYNGDLYGGEVTFYVLDGDTNITDLYFPNEDFIVDRFITTFETGRTRLIVYDTYNVQHNVFNFQNIANSFYFVSANVVTLPTTSRYFNLFYTIYTNGTLNDAFTYAMSEFNDIGFGKIDFVSLIGDFFIDAAQFNNVYLKFINTYINYFLFVELVLFIPSVLHFVIHWFENLGKDISSGKEKD